MVPCGIGSKYDEMIERIEEFLAGYYTKSDYPTLEYQRKQWAVSKPLQGLRILDATPLFRNTLTKYIPLMASGAELTVGLNGLIKPNAVVLDFLHEIGLRVIMPGDMGESFDVILDCAGGFSALDARIGYVELTRSGVAKYERCTKPVYVADSGRIKRIETTFGTGESYFRAMRQLGYDDWKGRRLVIFGAGKVGTGIRIYAEQFGAICDVITEESTPDEVRQAIKGAYAVVTATGVPGALRAYARDLAQSDALIANMGVEDEFGEELPSERVLCAKGAINFVLEEPTHLRFIEATMALHNYGAIEVLENRHLNGAIEPRVETEDHLFDIIRRYGRGDLKDPLGG